MAKSKETKASKVAKAKKKTAPAAKAGAKPAAKKPAKATKPKAIESPKPKPKAAPEPSPKDLPQPVTEALAETPALVETVEAPAKSSKRSYATADSMAKAQRNISVSEFFAKNRHLLGFDNPRKALLTTIKEAVDNSLDACEEAGIAPRIEIWIEALSETHFRVSVQDNGPGIVKAQIPNIFGRLLYGSKFHAMKMARGQQGIGISAAGMYGLLTTGKNVQIISRTGARKPAHYYELRIDTRNNKPDVLHEHEVPWDDVEHGTKVTIELSAKYQKGRASVDEYLQQTAIANPHATLLYHSPDGRHEDYAAATVLLPPPPKSVRPHPYGVELGVLIRMLHETHARTLQQFFTSEFSRVSAKVAQEIFEKAKLPANMKPSKCDRQEAVSLHEAIQATKIMAPSTDCVVPIGKDQLAQGLQQVVQAEFYTSVTRSPAVYRGNPFIVEAALAYGQKESAGGGAEADELAEEPDGKEEQPLVKVIRFANRVPLLYQQSACAIYKSIVQMNWRQYGLPQGRGALPSGPATIVVHLASVWVPFTSESKEAVADYPEITKEIKLALQECGRRLGQHVRRHARQQDELKKRSYIEKYIPHIGRALKDILDLNEKQVNTVNENLNQILHRSRKL